jgi:hypothetical protein
MSVPFPEPAGSPAEVFLRYLDYFRSRLAAELQALPAADLCRTPGTWVSWTSSSNSPSAPPGNYRMADGAMAPTTPAAESV